MKPSQLNRLFLKNKINALREKKLRERSYQLRAKKEAADINATTNMTQDEEEMSSLLFIGCVVILKGGLEMNKETACAACRISERQRCGQPFDYNQVYRPNAPFQQIFTYGPKSRAAGDDVDGYISDGNDQQRKLEHYETTENLFSYLFYFSHYSIGF